MSLTLILLLQLLYSGQGSIMTHENWLWFNESSVLNMSHHVFSGKFSFVFVLCSQSHALMKIIDLKAAQVFTDIHIFSQTFI